MVRLERPERRHAAEQHRDVVGRDPGRASRRRRRSSIHQGVWATKEWMLGDAKGATWPTDEAGYFHKIGWIHAPAAREGRPAGNLSHPIVYVVNPKSRTRRSRRDARRLSRRCPTTTSSTRSARPPRHPNGERSMPAYKEAWYLARGDADAGAFRPSSPTTRTSAATTASSSRRLQGVETGRLSPDEAVDVPRGRADQRARRQGRWSSTS